MTEREERKIFISHAINRFYRVLKAQRHYIFKHGINLRETDRNRETIKEREARYEMTSILVFS